MLLNFAFNLNITLSSADNPFKQFGPKSGPDILSGQDRDPNCLTLRGYDKLKLNQCII